MFNCLHLSADGRLFHQIYDWFDETKSLSWAFDLNFLFFLDCLSSRSHNNWYSSIIPIKRRCSVFNLASSAFSSANFSIEQCLGFSFFCKIQEIKWNSINFRRLNWIYSLIKIRFKRENKKSNTIGCWLEINQILITNKNLLTNTIVFGRDLSGVKSSHANLAIRMSSLSRWCVFSKWPNVFLWACTILSIVSISERCPMQLKNHNDEQFGFSSIQSWGKYLFPWLRMRHNSKFIWNL